MWASTVRTPGRGRFKCAPCVHELDPTRSQACLHPEPEKRLSCTDLLRLPYFANAESWFPAEFWGVHVRRPPWAPCILVHRQPAANLVCLQVAQTPSLQHYSSVFTCMHVRQEHSANAVIPGGGPGSKHHVLLQCPHMHLSVQRLRQQHSAANAGTTTHPWNNR